MAVTGNRIYLYGEQLLFTREADLYVTELSGLEMALIKSKVLQQWSIMNLARSFLVDRGEAHYFASHGGKRIL